MLLAGFLAKVLCTVKKCLGGLSCGFFVRVDSLYDTSFATLACGTCQSLEL